ncbi:hypothetical protein MMJ09_21780, partial [Bacillus vallismortis]|nr:hypothetical protein [Bacillus vallismortis]
CIEKFPILKITKNKNPFWKEGLNNNIVETGNERKKRKKAKRKIRHIFQKGKHKKTQTTPNSKKS